MSPEKAGNGWAEWRTHVLAEIQRLNNNLETLQSKNTEYILNTSVELSKLRSELSRLKAVSGLYGAIAGTIAGLILKEVISRW